MPEDQLQQLFERVARADLTAPPADQVLARGRQRRHRARLSVLAMALVVVAAAALGARQLAGTTASSGPVTRSTTPGHPRPTLPPPGSGRLILALNGSDRFVMTRAGSAAAPVPVPGLPVVLGGPSQLATNPRGGWVVTYSTDPGAPYGGQPQRLALVTATGKSEPFGPVFRLSEITSVAVSPDGSRVAIAYLGPSSYASGIEVRPMPGHHGRVRTWHFKDGQSNDAVSLSWAPDGRRLSYIAGVQTGGGLAGAVETLNTAARGSAAPGQVIGATGPPWGLAKLACMADAAVWLGATGRFIALEECGDALTGQGREILVPINWRTAPAAGSALVIAHQTGCGEPGLTASPDGSVVLVSYCGIFLEDHGELSKLPAWLIAAAFAG